MSFQTAADDLLGRLAASKDKWVQTPIAHKLELLKQSIAKVTDLKDEWIKTSVQAKQGTLNTEDPVYSNEVSNILLIVYCMKNLAHVLESAAEAEKNGKELIFTPPPATYTRPDGTTVVRVLPWGFKEFALWSNFTGELWMQPGKPASQGGMYLDKKRKGKVSLVLGAGNQCSVPILDIISKLFQDLEVVILKFNPINDYLKPFVDKLFEPFGKENFFFSIRGGAEEGAYLCQHPMVDSIHMTGSHITHDKIIWGSTIEEQQKNKKANIPFLKKPITSELGCITPVIIPPAKYSDSDLEWTAKNAIGMVASNCSFNCTSGKVYILSKNWNQKDAFIRKVKEVFATIPTQYPYYPGAHDRYKKILDKYSQSEKINSPTQPNHIPWTIIPDVPPNESEYIFNNEPFCPVMAFSYLEETDPGKFLTDAVNFANTKLWGNLSANMIIHPSLNISKEVDAAIVNLRYGAVAVNCWGSINYAFGNFWGGYNPDNTLADVKSGIGYVHNSFLFDYPLKSVFRSTFKMPFGLPFPWFPKFNGFGYCMTKLADAQITDSNTDFIAAMVANILYGK